MRAWKKVLAAACLAVLPATAAHASWIDASNLAFSWSTPTAYPIGPKAGSWPGFDARIAQTATIQKDGELAAVLFPVWCTGGTLVAEVWDVDKGLPGPNFLADGESDAATLAQSFDTGTSMFYVKLNTRLKLAQGTEITVVLWSPDGECYVIEADPSPGYADGTGFFEFLPYQPGWNALSAFPGIADDFPFALIMR